MGPEIRDIVWGANEILAPAVGVRLDVDDMTTWKVDDETDLDALLTKLHEQKTTAPAATGLPGSSARSRS